MNKFKRFLLKACKLLLVPFVEDMIAPELKKIKKLTPAQRKSVVKLLLEQIDKI